MIIISIAWILGLLFVAVYAKPTLADSVLWMLLAMGWARRGALAAVARMGGNVVLEPLFCSFVLICSFTTIVIGPKEDPRTKALWHALNGRYLPGAAVALSEAADGGLELGNLRCSHVPRGVGEHLCD